MRVTTLPSLAQEYWRAFSRRKPELECAQQIPRLSLEIEQVRVDAAALARYRAFVGNPHPFPLAYAYVLAQPAHFHLVNLPEFPVRAAGLVHVDNRIVRHADCDPARALSLRVHVSGERPRRQGREFTLATEFHQDGRLVMEMHSGCFTRVRAPRREHAPTTAPPAAVPEGTALAELCFAAHFGRRYARVSGDWNPIHLAHWLARPFGFRRAIAHGAGAMALIEAELDRRSGRATRAFSITFRRPLELPQQTRLHRRADSAEGYLLLDAQSRELLHGERC
ncbi:MAG: hypothetical protein IT479_02010 [Xanthomonadales bacterium]|nr:hypothetical protein [Xanthomonadales bacterium]